MGTEKSGEALKSLRRALRYGEPHAFLIRRSKKDMPDLPPKTEELLYCDMSPGERGAHRELLASLVLERRKGRHLAILHRLGTLYQHLALLRGDFATASPERLLAESSKLRAVVAKLHEIKRCGQKAIVFARHIDVQGILAQVFQHEFSQPVRIINGATSRDNAYKGSTAATGRAKDARKNILREFRERRGFAVIILSPHVAGLGLTITEANHVIHYGRWWNPAVESQATDRAYRIGQTLPVTVHLPILRDPTRGIPASFDERLHELMQSKAGIARDFLHPATEEDSNGGELCDVLVADAEDIAPAPSAAFTSADLDRLAPHDFEAAVAALYQAEGYSVVLTSKSGDGGADVLAIKRDELLLIQAKHSRGRAPVDVLAVSDVLAACDIYGPRLNVRWRAALVSNSPMAQETVLEAGTSGVEIVSGDRLVRRLGAHRVGLGAMSACAAARCATFEEGIQKARGQLAPRR